MQALDEFEGVCTQPLFGPALQSLPGGLSAGDQTNPGFFGVGAQTAQQPPKNSGGHKADPETQAFDVEVTQPIDHFFSTRDSS